MHADGHWGRLLGGAAASSGDVAKYIFCPMNRCQSAGRHATCQATADWPLKDDASEKQNRQHAFISRKLEAPAPVWQCNIQSPGLSACAWPSRISGTQQLRSLCDTYHEGKQTPINSTGSHVRRLLTLKRRTTQPPLNMVKESRKGGLAVLSC